MNLISNWFLSSVSHGAVAQAPGIVSLGSEAGQPTPRQPKPLFTIRRASGAQLQPKHLQGFSGEEMSPHGTDRR